MKRFMYLSIGALCLALSALVFILEAGRCERM